MKRLIARDERAELDSLIRECTDYNNWIMPDAADLELEYNVEYKHHIVYEFGDIWPTLNDFLAAANAGQVITLTEQQDYEIGNRSHTMSMNSLISLVSSYRSWPEFKNMNTVQDIIEGFAEDQPMKMPIILEQDGYRQIISGNTRLDIAFMMNVTPQVLIITLKSESQELEE